jgi:hypothetical protein
MEKRYKANRIHIAGKKIMRVFHSKYPAIPPDARSPQLLRARLRGKNANAKDKPEATERQFDPLRNTCHTESNPLHITK